MSTLPSEAYDNVGGLTFPTGLGPIPWMGAAEPAGWYLLKPGQGFQTEAIADYPALAQLVGTRWGGDGITTFAMPQAGLFTRGPDGAHSLWALLGEDAHTLALAEIPAHGHTATVTDPGHHHGLNTNDFLSGSDDVLDRRTDVQGGASLDTAAAFTGISVAIANAGGGGSHNNIPKALTVNLIVKA